MAKSGLAPKIETSSASDTPQQSSRDYNPFWQSTLFHEIFLRNDIPEKFKAFWLAGEEGKFGQFCNSFRNLCSKYEQEEFNNWSERTTIRNWIIPILEMLGYQEDGKDLFIEDEPFTIDKRVLKPDFVITNRSADLSFIQKSSGQEKVDEGREYVKLVVEAKYWARLEDQWNNKKEDRNRADKKSKDEFESVDPASQILKYMSVLQNDWGVMTDGKFWRLYHSELSGDSHRRYFQFNLGHLYQLAKQSLSQSSAEYETFIENAKYFYYVFCKESLVGTPGKETVVNASLEFSKAYAETIEEDLRERFRDAMIVVCNGFHRDMGRPESSDKLVNIRDLAESHLFNIMFILSCESKGIIQMKGEYRERSLSRIIASVEKFKPERGFDDHNHEILQRSLSHFSGESNFKFSWDGTEIYDHLLDLTELVQKGTNPKFNNFKIDKFTESVFSATDWSLAKKYKLKNSELIYVLFKIGYLQPASGGKKPKKIPYNFLTARQLGSIYEGFLEYKIEIAQYDIALIGKEWKQANISSAKIKEMDVPTAHKGELFFEQDDTKKKNSGSYYTPDYIVQMIVQETLAPLLEAKKAKDILKIKICDPALGSGHFVNAALNFLANEYLAALETESTDDIRVTIQDVKRDFLNNSIFGVDVNPRAIKLTKMSLWLESAKTGLQLNNLEEKIRLGDTVDSTTFSWQRSFKNVFDSQNGFDAVLMNPPYLGIKDNSHVIGYLRDLEEWKDVATNKYDILYFFLARATQICNSSGRIGTITTSYWPTADGADKLRAYLSRNSSLKKCIMFNELKLFKSAKGQHNLVCYFSKEVASTEPIQIMSLKAKKKGFVLTSMNSTDLNRETSAKNLEVKSFISSLSNPDLESLILQPWNLDTEDGSKTHNITDKMKSLHTTISDQFCVHSGIETGADRATRKHIEPKAGADLDRPIKKYLSDIESCNIKIGDGVFVLRPKEVQQLSLSKTEKDEYIFPLIKNGNIRGDLNFDFSNTGYSLVYFQNGKIKAGSKVYRHLEKFKPILENRYKFRTEERLKWFDLHRPLSQKMIDVPKIINPYRAIRPVFSYCSKPSYALLDVFFVIPEKENANINLALGLLNSIAVWFWLRKEGKTKGDIVELTAGPISKIPFKNYHFEKSRLDRVKKSQIEQAAEKMSLSQEDAALFITSLIENALKAKKKISDISETLDCLACCYYGISKIELKVIRSELNTLIEAAEKTVLEDEFDKAS